MLKAWLKIKKKFGSFFWFIHVALAVCLLDLFSWICAG
jgi:hypothetical protein